MKKEMTKAESILLKNEKLFQEHPFDDMYLGDKDAILKCMNGMVKERTVESFMIGNGKAGDIFYSHKMDRHITAIATHHKRKIQTERLLLIGGTMEEATTDTVTKVTLL